ncbi:hypothetical protein KAH55_06760, partial [bacterium]|nr:hypothetical protein [bacterium]
MSVENAKWLTGQPILSREPAELHAGSLSVQYENGSIRAIKSGQVEVLRMIYSAVRDHNWGTVEPIIHDEKIEKFADSFRIHYMADYEQNDIAFEAEYTITGSADGIRFALRGTALSSFNKNRIGFCILHPIK